MKYFRITTAVLLSSLLFSGELLAAAAEVRPNVIVILADDLGYGDIGCYNGWIKTPQLDALASRGLRFTDFHSSGAVCSPTRAGLMTGRYQQTVGVPGVVSAAHHRDKGLALKYLTFAEVLRKAGYRTGMFGKWHLGYDPKYNPVNQGFDVFRGYVSGNVDYFSHIDQAGHYDWWNGIQQVVEEGYVTHLVTQHGLDFIETNRDRPFCLYLAHEAPHYPYQGPNDKPDRTVGGKFDNHGSRMDKKEAYREMVEAVDLGVGQIVEKLAELKLSERTLIVFSSDNGATALGSCGVLNGYKGSLWEGGHRVPAIAVWPGRIPAGKVTDETAISLDLFPTMLAVTGASVPEGHHLDGTNLLPLMTAGEPLSPRTLYWRFGKQLAMREGDWKIVRIAEKRSKATPRRYLFNLADDLEEQHDLAEKDPERFEQMWKKLRLWDEQIGPDEFGS